VRSLLSWRELSHFCCSVEPETAAHEEYVQPGFAAASGWALAAWAVVRLVGFVVITPLAEELAFRGYLLRRLIAADFDRVSFRRFTWTSFLISSVLFGAVHGQWIAGTIAGMAYALVSYATGRLWPAVLAHACTNALLLRAGLSISD
jgi:CAAX prenyl protease-like protein